MPDLRARQKAMASQAIVDACAALVTERHHLDFSMKEVADRAGVSLRTVYNHFATREELLDALGRVFNERMAAMGGPRQEEIDDFDGLLGGIARAFSVFDEMGGLSEAMAQLALADIGRDPDRAARTQIFVDAIVDRMPGVPEEEARAIALMLRHLLSHRTWFWLTREYGLTTHQATDLVAWAATALTTTATSGDLPSSGEEP